MRNKSDQFPADLIRLAKIAKALSHPARIRILQVLADCNTCITGELVGRLPLAQATVSQHLLELKTAGFIKGEIQGPKTCYCLDHQKIAAAGTDISRLFQNLSKINVLDIKGD